MTPDNERAYKFQLKRDGSGLDQQDNKTARSAGAFYFPQIF